jgi:F-type H+-transporting ATPase subunit epsilon
MKASRMRLRILLPFQVFAEESSVVQVIVETREGSFGLLPRRLDCVAAITPGILVYQTDAEVEAYVAVDEGVLVKSGAEVLVSVRRAFAGTDLERLRDAVEEEFLTLDDQEHGVRAALARMESAFIRRMAALGSE